MSAMLIKSHFEAMTDLLTVGMMRNILLFVMVMAVPVSALNIFLINPMFKAFIVDVFQTQSVRVARHLSETVAPQDAVPSRDLVEPMIPGLRQSSLDFGLYKLKIFTPQGETIYSSDPKTWAG